MKMKEVWTKEAKETYLSNMKYLKTQWTKKEIQFFIDKSFEAIDLLLQNPKLGSFDARWKAYKFLIVPQVYLYYEVKNDELILLTFWNNYQKPLF